MATFLNLQDGFYNALVQGIGLQPGDPFLIMQPSPALTTNGDSANKLLWDFFNNIPPFSLTQSYYTSGGNQFFSDYAGVLSVLMGAKNNFDATVGIDCSAAWKVFIKTLPYTTPTQQLPMIFRNWAMRNGFTSVAMQGASQLSAALLDPITNAQFSILLYQNPDATYKNPDWDADIKNLVSNLQRSPSRSFQLSSTNMNSNTSNSWTRSGSSGFFGLWGSSHYESKQSSEFASSRVDVNASFKHVLQFSATPGSWYNSSALANAYSNKVGAPWIDQSRINWGNTFDPVNGNMTRFTTDLIVVDSMHIEVNSDVQYSKDDQTIIQNNSGAGMWPFYSSGGSDSSIVTKCNFDSSGMHVVIDSTPDVPILLGVMCMAVDKYLGHAVDGAAIYAKNQLISLG